MTNPYAPSAVECAIESRPQKSAPIESLFWVKHFFTFQFSFAFIWLSLSCANAGIANVVKSLFVYPSFLFTIHSVGIGVWVVHAILAIAYRRMRRVRATTTAIVGSTSWLTVLLIFDCLRKLLPEKLWTALSYSLPIILFTLNCALSIVAVWLVVRMHSDHPPKR